MCQLDKKDNEINPYLSKTLPNSVAIGISQSGRCVSRDQEDSNTNKIFAKEKLFDFFLVRLLLGIIKFYISSLKNN